MTSRDALPVCTHLPVYTIYPEDSFTEWWEINERAATVQRVYLPPTA